LKDQLKILLIWLSGIVGRNIFLTGPTGAGKTSLIEQLGNRLEIPVWKYGCHLRMEFQELVGCQRILSGNGGMQFVYGPLVNAMKQNGILLLDESDLMHPSTAMALNSVLDDGGLFVPETNEYVIAGEHFRIACSGNSKGGGDETGLYRGFQKQNVAWMSRFFATMKINYLDASEELKLLAKLVPGVPEDITAKMVQAVNEVRTLFIGSECEVALSTRELLNWARLSVQLTIAATKNPVNDALHLVVLNRCSDTDAETVKGVWNRISGSEM